MKLDTKKQRAAYLEKCGFLKKEARQFAKNNWRKTPIPYFEEMLGRRRRSYTKFIARGGSQEKWIKKIERLYAKEGFTKKTTRRVGGQIKVVTEIKPFGLFKAREKEFKNTHPDYSSPPPSPTGISDMSPETKYHRTMSKKGKWNSRAEIKRRKEMHEIEEYYGFDF